MTKKEFLEKTKDAPDNAELLALDSDYGFTPITNVVVKEAIKNPRPGRWGWRWDSWWEGCKFKKQGVAIFMD